MVRKGSPVRVRQRASAPRRGLRVSVVVLLSGRVHSASKSRPVPRKEGVAGSITADRSARGRDDRVAVEASGSRIASRCTAEADARKCGRRMLVEREALVSAAPRIEAERRRPATSVPPSDALSRARIRRGSAASQLLPSTGSAPRLKLLYSYRLEE